MRPLPEVGGWRNQKNMEIIGFNGKEEHTPPELLSQLPRNQ